MNDYKMKSGEIGGGGVYRRLLLERLVEKNERNSLKIAWRLNLSSKI